MTDGQMMLREGYVWSMIRILQMDVIITNVGVVESRVVLFRSERVHLVIRLDPFAIINRTESGSI